MDRASAIGSGTRHNTQGRERRQTAWVSSADQSNSAMGKWRSSPKCINRHCWTYLTRLSGAPRNAPAATLHAAERFCRACSRSNLENVVYRPSIKSRRDPVSFPSRDRRAARTERAHRAILFTHMAFDMVDPLTVLRPMPVVGKTWALAWMRIVGRALPRRRENRVSHFIPAGVGVGPCWNGGFHRYCDYAKACRLARSARLSALTDHAAITRIRALRRVRRC